MLKRALLILTAASLPAAAQKTASAASGVETARAIWGPTRDYLVQAATDAPETMYAYKPVADVRTFGELIGHVAGSQRMFCAIALGEKAPAEDAIEKSAKTKAALVQALKESNDYCARAYQQSDAAAASMVDLFGSQRSKLHTLLENAMHNGEHYGNIVTYMRMNKMVPPSSRPRPSGD